MESVLPYVLAIVPTIGVGTLFYFVIKSILEGDRRERLAQARWEAAHDRATTSSTSSTGSTSQTSPATANASTTAIAPDPAAGLPQQRAGKPASDNTSTGR